MNDRLALGSAQFGADYGVANQAGIVAPDQVRKIVAAAAANGIRTLDTAIAYGTAESVLGSCSVTGWDIVTKLPAFPSDCTDVLVWAFNQIEESMARLNVERVHGVLLHRPDQLLGNQGGELLEALQLMKVRGYTTKIGVSIYAPSELEGIFALHPFELVQAPLNILDRRLVESGWAQRLRRQGVELHARSVFLQGLLLMSAAQRPDKFARWPHIWKEWDCWLAENCLTPLEACLRYVMSVQEVDRLIVGVNSLIHLQDILSSVAGDVPDLPTWSEMPEVKLINPAHWSEL